MIENTSIGKFNSRGFHPEIVNPKIILSNCFGISHFRESVKKNLVKTSAYVQMEQTSPK